MFGYWKRHTLVAAIVFLTTIPVVLHAISARPPWHDMDRCDLARFAHERYAAWAGLMDFPDFLAAGVAIDRTARPHDLIVAVVRREPDGSESGKAFYLSHDPITGAIETRRMSESPASIRARGLPPRVCSPQNE